MIKKGTFSVESFLAKQRASMANRLILGNHRKGRILNIGCGKGFFLTNTAFSKKYGVNRFRFQIDRNSSNFSKVNLINYNIESNGLLPFKDSSFSVVTMLASIEHIEPSLLVKLIDEIYRVLVIDGKLIITFPAGWTDKLLWLMGKFNVVNNELYSEHKDNYNVSKVRLVIERTKFGENGEMRYGYFEILMNVWVTIKKK